MAHINLLPWREELRKERQKEFATILGLFALLAVGVVFFIHIYNNQMIDYQNARNQYLDKQIAELDKKILEIKELEKQKERMLSRMDAIQDLQRDRPLIVRLFDEIVTSIPDGVSLQKIKQVGDKITINGEAQSNARVSKFMRNVEDSEWLDKPDLTIIEADAEDSARINKFILRFEQMKKDKDNEGEEL